MSPPPDLLAGAILLALAAVAAAAGSARWLLRPRRGDVPPARSGPTRWGVVATVAGACLLWAGGALWDASLHLDTQTVPGGDDFLWPPHLVLYAGFVLSLAAAAAALRPAAPHGWNARATARGHPELAVVALGSVYALAALPADALWHELYGADLTAWSPPHVLLILAATIQPLAALAHLRRTGALSTGKGRIAAWGLTALAANLVLLLLIEWDLPMRRLLDPGLLASRPEGAYAFAATLVVTGLILVAHRFVRLPFPATLSLGAALLLRAAGHALLAGAGATAPDVPIGLFAAAPLADVLAAAATRLGRWRAAGTAGLSGALMLPWVILVEGTAWPHALAGACAAVVLVLVATVFTTVRADPSPRSATAYSKP